MSKVRNVDVVELAKEAGFTIGLDGKFILASDYESDSPVDCTRQVYNLVKLVMAEAANIAHEKGKEHGLDNKAAGCFSSEAAIMRVANRITR